MSSTAAQLGALGNDQQFRLRVRSLLIQQAVQVYAESPTTPDTRRTYAKNVFTNPGLYAENVANILANSTNLIAGTTTYDFDNGRVVTNVTDAAIASQLATIWNMLAGA